MKLYLGKRPLKYSGLPTTFQTCEFGDQTTPPTSEVVTVITMSTCSSGPYILYSCTE